MKNKNKKPKANCVEKSLFNIVVVLVNETTISISFIELCFRVYF